MTQHAVGTREQHTAAGLELLEAEKELTRRSDELASQRQSLPWGLELPVGLVVRDQTSTSTSRCRTGRSERARTGTTSVRSPVWSPEDVRGPFDARAATTGTDYRAPRGRNEARRPDDPLNFFRRHDEYDTR